MKFFILLFLPTLLFAQSHSMDENLEKAFTNAKSGIYWALENIPERKKTLDKKLVNENKLIAEVKLTLEIGGLKIKSVGHHESYKVETVLYRSYENLIKEEFIDEAPEIKL